MARDLIWDAIVSACTRMGERVDGKRLVLGASTRRSWSRWEAVQGFEVIENWTDVLLFEPVRRRPLLSRKWREVQPVQTAAANVGRFLTERPDLR
jgi:hypothetical protein